MKQSRIDSFMEAVCNTFIGFWIALITQIIVFHFMGIEASWSENVLITVIFTAVSILRSYVLRRLFNGRSIWLTITNRTKS